ncbi:hypothetical protein [Pantoea vagans]|uniref:hypothetical protein n=1 Tax=Pantoea vagans TaxID=470934 RepID=UPI0023B1BEB4|nr:hypothetical protein [Pantoea vagans]MDE8556831.1 hypothetical protein [Pantoea vagans]MDE8576837.1 hypothetical protein [Pantoea vagans]
MKNLPHSLSLKELIEIISIEMENTPEKEINEKLMVTIATINDVYEIDQDVNNYILYSLVGLEEQTNKKTLSNAQAALKIINKKQGK